MSDSVDMAGRFFRDIADGYTDYLGDESRLKGNADSISFPLSHADVVDHVRMAAQVGAELTVQGCRTGITGGATPKGGHILNLSRMTRMSGVETDEEGGKGFLDVAAGATLQGLREHIDAETGGAMFFPPDPTEATASVGGMMACNASGSRSFLYGPTRNYVKAVRVVLADGDVVNLKRGEVLAGGGARRRAFRLKTAGGRVIEGELPSYNMPSVKNAAGYYCADNMDLLDLFIGAEGTLGVITDARLEVIRAPSSVWAAIAFFVEEAQALGFVNAIRKGKMHSRSSFGGEFKEAALAAIEYYDVNTLKLIENLNRQGGFASPVPSPPAGSSAAVYAEFHGNSEDVLETALIEMAETMAEHGGSEEEAWMASNSAELQRLKDFRHAVPETVNMLIDVTRRDHPGVTKLGTDLAVPDDALQDMVTCYHSSLTDAGLSYVIFGHIGDNHLHVNILPRDEEEYARGLAIYRSWAERAVALGGTVSAEHGVGKLKPAFLRLMYGEEGIRQMQSLKALFDPDGALNHGNLFED